MDLANYKGLRTGSSQQYKAYKALRELRVFERLSYFDPVLAGTVPLDLQIAGSDLDILCEVYDNAGFQLLLSRYFGKETGFRIKVKEISRVVTVICRFEHGEWPVEIFAQPVPVKRQHAYRHMVVEDHLLRSELNGRKEEARKLKEEGCSTEQAFAVLLGMEGDPYAGLLDMGRSLGLYD